MDNDEARRLLSIELAKYREKTYGELVALISASQNFEVVGASGAHYQVEIQGFWDDRPDQNLRVVGSIDDGGWRAFKPLTDDFIIGPGGEFIGE